MVRVTVASVSLAALLLSVWQVRSQDLALCGWDEVHALRISGTNVATLWRWSATNSDLPAWCKPLFATTDECKPCPGGRMLITSSGGPTLNGAVTLVQPKTSNVLFYARAPNAHSADLLPLNRVAVALSYHTNGNRLAVFNLHTPDVELFSVPLTGAHGVVWDERRESLWALADSYIREYRLQDWDTQPQLQVVSHVALPDGGGHDLYPVPNSPEMTVATGLHCWLFNRDTRTFRKHPLLGETASVKGISVHRSTGQLVYVRGAGPWWSEWLRFLTPDSTLHFPGARLYKARWLPPEAPRLSIFASSTNTTVNQWPSPSSEFVLQESTSLSSTDWVAPSELIQDNSVNKFITIHPPTGQRFYRLAEASP
jgi:hypothetical protein